SLPAWGHAPGVDPTPGPVSPPPPSHRGRCSYNQHAPTVGAPAPGANNGRLGILASPFAPRAVLLQSTRANRRSTRPGCEQGLARCSGFTLRTEGGAPTINTHLPR